MKVRSWPAQRVLPGQTGLELDIHMITRSPHRKFTAFGVHEPDMYVMGTERSDLVDPEGLYEERLPGVGLGAVRHVIPTAGNRLAEPRSTGTSP